MPAEERRPAEKAAAVISMLGTERASEVFRYLTENEVEQLSMEITRLPHLAPDEMEDIAKDFYNCCVTEKVITEGGKDYAKEVLEKAFGQQQARNLMDRVSKALKTKAFSFIRKVDYKTLMTAIQNEHPQTLALILSYATPEQAFKIIANLPQETRVDVVERIAAMDRALPMAIKIAEEVLEKKIGSSSSEETMEVGGLNYIADIMNHVDRSTERDIFDELNFKNPQLAEDVRKLMFVFEDIAYLDPLSIQRFLRETDSKDLAVALKVSNKDVMNAIFANMSNRMRESIQSDMEYLHNIRMSDVEEAQQRIVPGPSADQAETANGEPETAVQESADGSIPRYALISEEKRKILEHARSQAEQSAARILEEAYAQRDKIVNTALAEAERLKKQAEEEGYEDGINRAEADISTGLVRIGQAVEQAGRRLEEHSEEIKAGITEIALMIAEKILQREVDAGRAGLADLVEQAVLSEWDKNEITVHLSDDSIALVEELERRLEPLRDRNGGYVRIRPEQQQPGYVQIETEEGIVDASVFVQLENLKRQLAELLK